MSVLKKAYRNGVRGALTKFALSPPTQVDQFMADVDGAKDIAPPAAAPPMAGPPPTALDGTVPLSTSPPTPMDTIGSTIGDVPPPPPNMGALS